MAENEIHVFLNSQLRPTTSQEDNTRINGPGFEHKEKHKEVASLAESSIQYKQVYDFIHP